MKTLLFLLFASLIMAADIKPLQQAHIKGAVLDMVVSKGKVYVATDAGKVVVLDEQNLSFVQQIKVRKIKDFMGTLHDADIYSIDVLGERVLYLAQAEEGYAELYLYKDGKATKVLDKSAMLYAKAAKFVDKDHALLALMSDEVVLYDMKTRKILKRAKVGEYFYSALSMDPGRKYAAIGDEGGEVVIIDTHTLRRVKLFKDVNKDKILSICMNQNLVAAGSRADKTFAIYDWKCGSYKTKKNPDFFIYVVGLSSDNRLAVYGDNDKYILKVVDTNGLELRYRLTGHEAIVNTIRFLTPKELLSGSELGEIIKWRLP